MLGVVILLEGRRRLGLTILAASNALFSFAIFVFMPHYSNSLAWFAKRFAGDRGDSVSDVAFWIARHPVAALGDLVTLQNLALVAVLILTTGGLCLLAPRWTLLALPALAQNLLSAYPEQHWFQLHYQFPVMLGLAIAGAVGASRVSTLRPATSRRLLAVWIGIAFVVFPVGIAYAHSSGSWSERNVRSLGGPEARRQVVRLIPDDASVAASQLMLPHLSQRRELYSLPLPFISVDYGGDYSPTELEKRARDVQYVVLDGIDRPAQLPTEQVVLPPLLERLGFREIARHGSVRVYYRLPPR